MFQSDNFLRMPFYVTSSNMSSTIVQNVRTKASTSKEWNENSPDFVYHQLVPASFDVLWFETDSAVLTLLPFQFFLHMSPFCYEYNYGIRLTQPPK